MAESPHPKAKFGGSGDGERPPRSRGGGTHPLPPCLDCKRGDSAMRMQRMGSPRLLCLPLGLKRGMHPLLLARKIKEGGAGALG